MKRLLLVSLAGLFGLGGCDDRDRAAPSGSAAAPSSAHPESRPGFRSWAGRTLQHVSGSVDGVAFVLDVPIGLSRVDKLITVFWRAKPEGSDFDPQFAVRPVGPAPTTIDEALALVPREDGSHILRRESIEGGFLIAIAAPSNSYVHVHVIKASAGVALECAVDQASALDAIPGIDAEVTWMAKACASLKFPEPKT
jgi:hypothetical protein